MRMKNVFPFLLLEGVFFSRVCEIPVYAQTNKQTKWYNRKEKLLCRACLRALVGDKERVGASLSTRYPWPAPFVCVSRLSLRCFPLPLVGVRDCHCLFRLFPLLSAAAAAAAARAFDPKRRRKHSLSID